ncbi:NADP-dependent malic enzyme-like isoform X2 [Acanthaster planci]|uniref:Malic enzyme n=1 Tax=Acanthaster planci TaxID=133434 RepID=A0A8B7XM52_ACAPL|nr:NADP-dependent malic enzyme-like isoform X2 [Acanthaster planci]
MANLFLSARIWGASILRNPAFCKYRDLCRMTVRPQLRKVEQSSLSSLILAQWQAALRSPAFNKGTAFSLHERQALGIHGLLPPVVSTPEIQEQRALRNIRGQFSDLDRFIQLMDLQDRNEKLFYRVLCNNLEEMMPIVYTPTVGLACQRYGLIYRRPRGLFITIHDRGHVADILAAWPEQNVKAVVVTDGERILGLGDLGSYGMGIPVGKLALYTAIAGVQPSQCLPIMLDVGTNNQTLLDDPLYIGLREQRDRSSAYDELIDEFMEAVTNRYGQNCLIQFEDFGNKNAFRLLTKYRHRYCTFNDDIQGTASVAVAGILASLRITGKKLQENIFLFQGAGEASIGIANLLIAAMEAKGLAEDEARKRIWLLDSRGLICKDRPAGGIDSHKEPFAHPHEPMKDLEKIVQSIKPSALIGAAAVGGVFTEKILQDMASFNDRPIIFALSNPTSKAECTAEQAYTYTNGKCVFASGSPFPSHKLPDGCVLYPGQGNNSYIFPGVALGVVLFGVRHITDEMFLEAAKCLASLVTDDHLKEGRVYPPLQQVREVSLKLAVRIAEYAYETNAASRYPRPDDLETFVSSRMYDFTYESFEPQFYEWPKRK